MSGAPPVPLHELLDALRAEGFVIGVDDHLRVSKLIALEGAWSLDQLEIALGAMLVGDVRERASFEAAFRRFFAPATAELRAPAAATPVAVRPRRWWPIVAGALAIAVVTIALVWPRGRGATSAPVTPPTGVEVTDVTPPAEPSATVTASPAPVIPATPRAAPVPARNPELALGPTLSIGALGLAALVAGLLVWSSRRARRRGFVPGPWNFQLRPPPDQRAPFHGAAAIEDGAAHLTWQSDAEGVHTIDVEQTLGRTIEAGGFPRVVYQPPPAAPTYVVLEDDGPHARTWRGVTDELFTRLALEGVELRRYTFDESPERCVARDGSESISLDELAEHHDALLIVGDGDRAWDPMSERDADWLETLRSFHHRLWLNPLPPERWSPGARRIAAATPMEQATADGLGALDPGADRHDDDSHPYPAVIDLAPGSAMAAAALRDHLGGAAFRVLALGAVIGDPDVELARWLAHRFDLFLDGEAWLRLLGLRCYRDGRWPAGLRDHLVTALRADDPAAEVAARTLHLELLADAEPIAGSVAHLRWRLAAAQERVELGEPAAKAELARLASSPIHGEATGAMDAFGLPPRGRSIRALSALGLLVLGVGVFLIAPHLAAPAAPNPPGAYRIAEHVVPDDQTTFATELLVAEDAHEPPLVRMALDTTGLAAGSYADPARWTFMDVAPRDQIARPPYLVATFDVRDHADGEARTYAVHLGDALTYQVALQIPTWTPRAPPAAGVLRWRWLPTVLLALLALLVLGDAAPRVVRLIGAVGVVAAGVALHVVAPSWLSLAPPSAHAAPSIPAMELAGAAAPPAVDTHGMVRIAGRTFSMGVADPDANQTPNAESAHDVTVETFLLDATEVTTTDDQMPWANVTWTEADTYCREHNKRLPTSAEWELAASAGGIDAAAQRKAAAPSPVGSRAGDRTVDGVFDLLGNVMEWTADDWPDRPGDKIVRGASHNVAAAAGWYASIHARMPFAAGSADNEIGFRCAADAADVSKLVELGVEVYKREGCGACHSTQGADRPGASLNLTPERFVGGETLAGLIGAGKRFANVHDYLLHELEAPSELVVEGFSANMPSYAGRVSSEELDALATYLESIRPPPVAPAVAIAATPTLTPKQIQAAMKKQTVALEACVAGPTVALGDVSLAFVVDPVAGKASAVHATTTEWTPSPDVQAKVLRCMEGVVSATRFPTGASGAPVHASYVLRVTTPRPTTTEDDRLCKDLLSPKSTTFADPRVVASCKQRRAESDACISAMSCHTMESPPHCCTIARDIDGPDGDKDGVADLDDACNGDREDQDGFEDGDGCPDDDNDQDLILDVDDKCPNDSEIYNGQDDEDGCPDKGRVVVTDTRIEILEPVYFSSGSATIPKSSTPLIDAVAASLLGNPDILLVEVQGHCDDQEMADETERLELSERRAAAVTQYLIGQGVESSRLAPQGYGDVQPANKKHTAAARTKNRRVQYLILKRSTD